MDDGCGCCHFAPSQCPWKSGTTSVWTFSFLMSSLLQAWLQFHSKILSATLGHHIILWSIKTLCPLEGSEDLKNKQTKKNQFWKIMLKLSKQPKLTIKTCFFFWLCFQPNTKSWLKVFIKGNHLNHHWWGWQGAVIVGVIWSADIKSPCMAVCHSLCLTNKLSVPAPHERLWFNYHCIDGRHEVLWLIYQFMRFPFFCPLSVIVLFVSFSGL